MKEQKNNHIYIYFLSTILLILPFSYPTWQLMVNQNLNYLSHYVFIYCLVAPGYYVFFSKYDNEPVQSPNLLVIYMYGYSLMYIHRTLKALLKL